MFVVFENNFTISFYFRTERIRIMSFKRNTEFRKYLIY